MLARIHSIFGIATQMATITSAATADSKLLARINCFTNFLQSALADQALEPRFPGRTVPSLVALSTAKYRIIRDGATF